VLASTPVAPVIRYTAATLMLSQAYDLALLLYYTESLDVWGEQARVRPKREK
jgi:hypothetical protein